MTGFIIDQITNKDDKTDLYNVFVALDTDGNGILSREELMTGYSQIYPDLHDTQIKKDVEKIFEVADRNNSGAIYFSGKFPNI